jgi:hypothetical protein
MDENHESAPGLDDVIDRDWTLQTLVAFADQGIEIPVTLTTGAGLVSGIITSGAKFMDGFQKSLTAGDNQNVNELIKSVAEIWKARYMPGNESGSDQEDRDPPHYIHLRDAKLLVGNSFVPAQGTLWRGKIEGIIGFSVGTLTQE